MLPPELRQAQVPVGSDEQATVEPIVGHNLIDVWTRSDQSGDVRFNNKRDVCSWRVSPKLSKQRRREHDISNLIDAQNQDPGRLFKDAHQAVWQALKRYLKRPDDARGLACPSVPLALEPKPACPPHVTIVA